MTVHSPTPFRTDGNLIGYREGEDCPPQSWTLIARIEQGIGNRPACQHDQREANAAFIVAACNKYETLIETVQRDIGALHNLLQLIWDNRPDLADLPEYTEAAHACGLSRAAIAKGE